MKRTFIFSIAVLLMFDISLIFAAQTVNTQDQNDLAQLRALAQAGSNQNAQDLLTRLQGQQTQQPQRQPAAPTTRRTPTQAQTNQARPATATPAATATKPNQASEEEQRLAKLFAAQAGARKKLSTGAGGNNPVAARRGGAARISADRALDEKAFRTMANNLIPLNPQQIIRLRKLYDNRERAIATTPRTPPKPTATSQIVSLSPGSTPPVIRLSQGFVSSLVFLDSTGAPWPIISYDLGNPQAFNIQWDRSSNTLMVQSNKLYTYGNLAVRLKNLNTPVMLTLIPGQNAVDYRVDLRIQGYGPNAKVPTFGSGLPNGANPILLSVLDGVPPPNSKRLRVLGGEAEAWLQGKTKLFIRTRFTLLSPGWMATMSSADGTHVYELQKAPIILVSWHGQVRQLKLEGL
jgi:intracellular multiplication protein IcmK